MPDAVSVIFSPGGTVFPFDPGDLELSWNDRVICQTSRGTEYGRVVKAAHELAEDEAKGRLKKVVRKATDDDEDLVERRKAEAEEGLDAFRALRRKLDVDAHAVNAEVTLDGSRIVISYRSDKKPNVSALRRELGEKLEPRVELRSLGPRDAARACGGYGLCGTKMCCTRFPSYEKPIGLKMAKDQDLQMSSGRITGLCGRLRCCLAFEHPQYKSFRDRAPRVGAFVETPEGVGVVTSYAVPKDACIVELKSPPGTRTPRRVEISIDDWQEASEPREDEVVKAKTDRSVKRERSDKKTDRPKDGSKDRQRSRRRKRPKKSGAGPPKTEKGGASAQTRPDTAKGDSTQPGSAEDKPKRKRRSRRRRRRGGGGGGGGGSDGGQSSGPKGDSPGPGPGTPSA